VSLLDTLTGGESSAAQSDLEQALQAIQAVQVPTAQSMQYQLQQMVQTGLITPEQAQTYLQNPNAMLAENIPQQGTQAQEQAISEMLGAANAGGLTPQEQAQMQSIVQGLNTQEQGANAADVQTQAARGALTGGETLAAQLEGNQAADVNANQLGGETAANAYTQMLNELTSAGTAGQALQGQQNTQANTVAAATNAINQFNAAQQQNEENMNVTNTNAAQAANTETQQALEEQNVAAQNAYAQYQAQLPEEVEQNELQKAAAEAGVSEQQASQATTAGGQQAGLIGGLVGAAGDVGAAYATPATTVVNEAAPVAASKGGLIHKYLEGGDVIADNPYERARVAGNSPKNDKVPALLSEGEIVLPRTISRNPQPDKVMDFLNRIRKPKMPHPDDTAHVLQALGRLRTAQ
jgi:hypothetical protein